MKHWRRQERLVYITKYLVQHPGETINLNFFAATLGVAKSSISEDLALVKSALRRGGLGWVETELGAAGGVRYWPGGEVEEARALAYRLCEKIADIRRFIPGGFLYLTDIAFSPQLMAQVGDIFAANFQPRRPDYVVTVETKGIPIALMTARSLGVSLVTARREHRVTEGSAVSMSYVSGSTQRLQTMSLARRALPTGARVVLIDDFMKAGGTARGLRELLREFKAQIVGIGVLMEMAEPPQKLVQDYLSLLVFEGIDEERQEVRVRPSDWLLAEKGGEV
ncbi:MAG: pur operon repressor [Firmicutes bacterium]|nr:pur operon repressor [Bacillota bacterium]